MIPFAQNGYKLVRTGMNPVQFLQTAVTPQRSVLKTWKRNHIFGPSEHGDPTNVALQPSPSRDAENFRPYVHNQKSPTNLGVVPLKKKKN